MGWAALHAAFLTYQANRLLTDPYAVVGGVNLAAATVALLVSGALAASGRNFYKPLFAVAALAPAFLLFGLAGMGNVLAPYAVAQLMCIKGVGICFPQPRAFLVALGLAAAAGGAFGSYVRLRGASGTRYSSVSAQ